MLLRLKAEVAGFHDTSPRTYSGCRARRVASQCESQRCTRRRGAYTETLGAPCFPGSASVLAGIALNADTQASSLNPLSLAAETRSLEVETCSLGAEASAPSHTLVAGVRLMARNRCTRAPIVLSMGGPANGIASRSELWDPAKRPDAARCFRLLPGDSG